MSAKERATGGLVVKKEEEAKRWSRWMRIRGWRREKGGGGGGGWFRHGGGSGPS